MLWALAARLDLGGALPDVLIVAGRFGPSLAAIAVTLALAGRHGPVGLIAFLRRWRAPARGFALDRLQARIGPVVASVLLGVVWGLWPLPLFLDTSQVRASLPLALYLGQTTTTAIIYTWLWNRTHSLPLVLVLHTMTNLTAGVFPLLTPDAPDDLAFAVAVAIAGTAALVLIGTTRGRLGWQPETTSSAVNGASRTP